MGSMFESEEKDAEVCEPIDKGAEGEEHNMGSLLGSGGMVVAGGTICREWEQSSMPVINEAGVGIGMGSTELAGGGGHCFGVAPNAE